MAAAGAADGEGEIAAPLAPVERQREVEQRARSSRRNSCASGRSRTNAATAGSQPVCGRSSSTKNGLARKRASSTMSTSRRHAELVAERDQQHASAGRRRSGARYRRCSSSRSWWTVSALVSMMRSARARSSASSVRSRWMPASGPASPPSGCGRRVSLKRRTSTSSLASKNSDLEPVAGAAQLVEHARVVGEELALADVDAEGDAVDALERAGAELEEARDEHERQVVDAVEAEVLEDVDRGALPGPGEAGDDDDLEAGAHRWPAMPVRASHPLRG